MGPREADVAFFEERAAVREYEGGQPREVAEAAARRDLERWLAAELEARPGWRDRLRR